MWGGFAARVRSGHGIDDCALGSWTGLSLCSGHGMDLMIGWDQTISLGWDGICIIKIRLSIGWMNGSVGLGCIPNWV